MRKDLWFLGVAAVLVGGWACSDVGESGLTEPAPLASHVPACDLRGVLDAARRYLAAPLQRQATDKLRSIETAGCAGEASERLAWEVLAIVELAFNQRVGGAPADGRALVDGVLHCCIPSGSSFSLAGGSLAPGGAFGVRGALAGSAQGVSNTAPVVARDPVPILFGAEDGTQVSRPAVFALRPQPPRTWQDVAFASEQAGTFTDDVMLLAGFPEGPAPHVAYQIDEAPALGFQPGNQVDVIVCFTDGSAAPPDPHGPAGEDAFAARMRRNDVLLQVVADAEAFCQEWVWGPRALQAEVAEGSTLRALVRWAAGLVLPQPLLAALSDRTSQGFGGTAGNFSHFRPQNASTAGSLVFVRDPPEVVASTTTPFPVAVQALSGGGTPMELVDVSFFVQTNMGVPGQLVGTFTRCDGSDSPTAAGCTLEPDGIATVEMSVASPGGYQLCARATAAGFTFEDVCSQVRFHVRN